MGRCVISDADPFRGAADKHLDQSSIFSISFRLVTLITGMPVYSKAIFIYLNGKWTAIMWHFSTLTDKAHYNWTLTHLFTLRCEVLAGPSARNILICGQEELGIEPPIQRLVDDQLLLLSHSHPISET